MHENHPSPARIAYLGPPASFSHQAALAIFPTASHEPQPSFQSIFQALGGSRDGPSHYDYAVLPIENSSNGAVTAVLDLLARCPSSHPTLTVCGEHHLAVHHYLYLHPTSRSPAQIDTLYTHPQVWGQCTRYLDTHHAETGKVDVSSTSAAAQLVAQDVSGRSGAICSQLAGQTHGLACAAEQIEDEPEANTTRFVVLRDTRNRRQGEGAARPLVQPVSGGRGVNAKALLLFTIAHTVPGSLSAALNVFAKHSLNLTRIDTRPSRQHSWHYVFFVECEERVRDAEDEKEGRLGGAIEELKGVTESVVCLGRWIDMLRFKS